MQRAIRLLRLPLTVDCSLSDPRRLGSNGSPMGGVHGCMPMLLAVHGALLHGGMRARRAVRELLQLGEQGQWRRCGGATETRMPVSSVSHSCLCVSTVATPFVCAHLREPSRSGATANAIMPLHSPCPVRFLISDFVFFCFVSESNYSKASYWGCCVFDDIYVRHFDMPVRKHARIATACTPYHCCCCIGCASPVVAVAPTAERNSCWWNCCREFYPAMPDPIAFIQAYTLAQSAWQLNQRFGPNAFLKAGGSMQMAPMQMAPMQVKMV